MGEWSKPNDFSVVLRLTKAKYAKDFLDKGSIKFNYPQSWVNYYKLHGNGRGDIYEGTLAFCSIHDVDRVRRLNAVYSPDNPLLIKYRPIVTETDGNRLLLKDKRSMYLPCFCVYILKNSLFPCPDSVGKHRCTATIPASYFRDFSDNATPDEVAMLSADEQPALIVISDYEKFISKLYEALYNIGISTSEVVIGTVSYVDFETYGADGWMDMSQSFPHELLVKSNRFREQSEARIIITSKNRDALDYLRDHTLELGDLHGIAQVETAYLCEGILVEATLNVTKETEE